MCKKKQVFDHTAFKDATDLYDLLGLGERHESAPESITPADIKKAYRKLSLQYHPDKMGPNPDPKKVAIYQEMSAAYEVLGDEAKRAR